MALPSVLMGKRELSPRVSGKIRPGIMVLTKAGQANKEAAKLYDEGVAAGLSFEVINEKISKGCGAGLLRPINTAYFTVRGADFAIPEIATLILDRFAEVREDGVRRLYRFPVVFGSDELARIMDFRFQCFTASGLKFWSAESEDGMERVCRMFAPLKLDEKTRRAVRMPSGREVIAREDNAGRCVPPDCPEFQAGQCKMRGRLLFYIPGIAGAGLIEVPTGSKNFGFESEARLKDLLRLAGTLPTLVDGEPVLWLTKRLHRDIPMIDYEKGRTARTDQWIIEIEADIDMSRVRAAQSPLRIAAQARSAVAALAGPGAPTLPAAPAAAAAPPQRAPGTPAPQASGAAHSPAGSSTPKPAPGPAREERTEPRAGGGSPAVKELRRETNELLQALRFNPQRYAAHAASKWGERWSRTEEHLKLAIEELKALEPALANVRTSLQGLGLEWAAFDAYASSSYSVNWLFGRETLGDVEQELMNAFKDRENYVAAVTSLVSEAA